MKFDDCIYKEINELPPRHTIGVTAQQITADDVIAAAGNEIEIPIIATTAQPARTHMLDKTVVTVALEPFR